MLVNLYKTKIALILVTGYPQNYQFLMIYRWNEHFVFVSYICETPLTISVLEFLSREVLALLKYFGG